MQEQLQLKQRQLLELKKRKLELELAATQRELSQTTTEATPGAPTSTVLVETVTDPLHKQEVISAPARNMEYPIQTVST